MKEAWRCWSSLTCRFNTRRGRGSYICETDQGLKLLCECTGSEKRLVFLNQVLQQVRDGGYEQVDMVIANREGSLVSRDKDEIPYVLKDWFPGRECDTASETDIRRSVQNLARLHRVLLWSAEEELPYPRQGLALDYEKKTRELKKVRTFIRRRDPKNNFELKFLGCFSEFFAEAEETRNALARLEDAEEGEQETRLLCHGDYDHHHVLLTDSGTATIGFEKCRGGYPITDLYQFMRKILEKQNWSLRMGMIMLRNDQNAPTFPGRSARC